MIIETRYPTKTVNITLKDLTVEDLEALIFVLDADRNHPTRSAVYRELCRARTDIMTGRR